MQLNFPAYDFKISEGDGKSYIFDIIRKKNVVLIPEEWVRQHIIKFLIENNYPASLISVERQLKFNQLKKRFDILVYDNQAKPIMLIECKAPDVKLSQETLNQIALYNTQFKVDYLFISNGLTHLIYRFDKELKKYYPLKNFPNWNSLKINT
jgi:hypothetical protein